LIELWPQQQTNSFGFKTNLHEKKYIDALNEALLQQGAYNASHTHTKRDSPQGPIMTRSQPH